MSKSNELLPSTYLTVLSLIGGGARYGYQINKILEERGYRNWVDIKFSSIYKALNELEKKGLIKGEKSDQSLQPSRKTWILTKQGSKLLKKQIKYCLSDAPPEKSMFDLGMSAIYMLTKNEALKELRKRINNLSQALKFFEYNLEGFEKLDQLRKSDSERLVGATMVKDMPQEANLGFVIALFERPYVRVKCEKKWLESLVHKIEKDEAGFTFNTGRRGK